MTYYVLMDNEKICHYRSSMEYLKIDCKNNNIPFDEKNVVEVEEEPILYRGELHFKNDVPEKEIITEKQKERRAQAYLIEIDPITAHIQRERDEEIPDEEKISALIAERAEKVEEIKEKYPYPEDTVANGDQSMDKEFWKE